MCLGGSEKIRLFSIPRSLAHLHTEIRRKTRGTGLTAFSTDAACELNVLGHDGDTLGVNGAQVGVFKESDKVGLGSLLKGKHGRSLEPQVVLEVLGNLTNETLEGKLADEEVSRLLVATNLTEGHGSWAVTVGLLDASGGRGGLASSLGGELLTRSLASGGLAGGLLGTGHCCGINRLLCMIL